MNAQSNTSQKSTDYSNNSEIPQKIEIGFLESVLGVAIILVSFGIAWGRMKALVSGIKDSLDKKIEPELKDVRERFIIVEDRVGSMWKDKFAPSNSPRRLNEKGKDILAESGIKDIIDQNKEKLFELVKSKQKNNAYDAEVEILSVVMNLRKHCPEVVEQLKNGAFKAGADIDAVLFVGGIYLRDIIFKDLGFSLDDLDNIKK